MRSAAVLSAAAFAFKPTFVFGRNSVWSNNSPDPDNFYRREMFEPYIGDIFHVRVGKQMVNLQLVAIENVSPASRGITTGKVARTDCFSMRFQTTTKLPATGRMHNLNHSKLGSFDLFMNQSKDRGKFLHTAVVNHVI